MNKPDGYDLENRRFVAGCRRLIEAIRNGPIQEDPIRLDVPDEVLQSHPQPKVRIRLYAPEGEE
jgi:hypothetical protein